MGARRQQIDGVYFSTMVHLENFKIWFLSISLVMASIWSLPQEAYAQTVSRGEAWQCKSKEDWEIAQVILDEGVIFNNFLFTERNSLMTSGLRVIEVSFSARNRSDATLPTNTQVVGIGHSNSITFALAVDPGMDILSANSNETLSDSSYIYDTVLEKTEQICIGFIASR